MRAFHAFLLFAGFIALGVLIAPSTRAQLSPFPASSLSAADVTTARGAPITQGGKSVVTSTAGTTPKAPFSDVSSANRVATYVQNIRVANRHASQGLCVFDLAWSGASTCQTLCAASSGTCSAAATDGAYVPPGGSYSESWDGTACLCFVGSGASTTYTAERVARGAN